MRKVQLVSDIHGRLTRAGYTVTKQAISAAFPSKKRGKYCPDLLRVWNASQVWWLVKLLQDRGVAMIAPDEDREVQQLQRGACPHCGYRDPQRRHGVRCPNCDL